MASNRSLSMPTNRIDRPSAAAAKCTETRSRNMDRSLSRRTFVASAMAVAAAPALRTGAIAAEQPLLLRCSLDTPPSHMRNVIVRDYLRKIETASDGRIKTQLFESGQLFPDLQAGKALLQGQIEM